MLGDDLVPLLIPGPQAGLGFRQGVILSWNPSTAENVVDVGGTIMANLPILNTNEAVLLSEGSVVAVITYGSSWFILGRITIPGTPEAASALSMVRTFAASVATGQTTTSLSYTDLATVGPTVDLTVGPSGRLLVMVSAAIDYSDIGGNTAGAYMSYQVVGPTTRNANDQWAFQSTHYDDTGAWYHVAQATATSLQTGLTPGPYTVTCRYRAGITGTIAQFTNRLLVAIPL